jgi:hypothetical protein
MFDTFTADGSSHIEICTLLIFNSSVERQLMLRNRPHWIPSIQQSNSPLSIALVLALTRHSMQTHVVSFGT